MYPCFFTSEKDTLGGKSPSIEENVDISSPAAFNRSLCLAKEGLIREIFPHQKWLACGTEYCGPRIITSCTRVFYY